MAGLDDVSVWKSYAEAIGCGCFVRARAVHGKEVAGASGVGYG